MVKTRANLGQNHEVHKLRGFLTLFGAGMEKNGIVMKWIKLTLELGRSGFKTHLWHLLAMQLWENQSTF